MLKTFLHLDFLLRECMLRAKKHTNESKNKIAMLLMSKPPKRPPNTYFYSVANKTLPNWVQLMHLRLKLLERIEELERELHLLENKLIFYKCVATVYVCIGILYFILIPPSFATMYVFFKALSNYGFHLLQGISCHNFLQY